MATWTKKHREEALRYCGACLAAGTADGLTLIIQPRDVETEEAFRGIVVRLFDMFGEDRAVRKVRALAEGRLVREENWYAGLSRYETEGEAREMAKRLGVPVKVKRAIVRAP
jgi:hypothetical protein